jgi:type IV pilus assembly protein PilF
MAQDHAFSAKFLRDPMTARFLFRSLRLACPVAVLLIAGCGTMPGQGPASASPAPQTTNKLAEVHTKLGIGYLREGKLELAFNRLTRAIAADPGYSTAHNAMGTLQERLGDMQSAERHFSTAVSLDPTDSSAQSNFGSFLCRTGRYQEGEQRFLQALKNSLYERPEVAYNNAGLCMKTAGDMDKAETYFRAALERDPRIPSALLAMSEISFLKQRYLPARAYLQRFQETSALDAAALWLGVRIERELRDNETAERYSVQLRQKFPDSEQARLLDTPR